MKVHLRFDANDSDHALVTLFVNGKYREQFCLSPAEALWFHNILSAGCSALSPKGRTPIEFVSSGRPPVVSGVDMDKEVGGPAL
jgi:hypothetical protein